MSGRLTPCSNDHPKLPRPDWEATILRLGLLLPTGFSVMSFAAISAFEAANLVAGERFYDLRILSETGEPLTNSLGWTMNTEPLGEGSFDTLMVGSGPDLVPATPGTVAYLREAVSTTRRITQSAWQRSH
jgi:transcriptional regulator GlxA family with amidase domain